MSSYPPGCEHIPDDECPICGKTRCKCDENVNKVRNHDELIAEVTLSDTWKSLEKAVYKGTACWVQQVDGGVKVGSIVEGSDEGAEAVTVKYPFVIDHFWDAVQNIKDQCDAIWKATHGCEKCWEKDGVFDESGQFPLEFGSWPINPECPECNGEGTII